MSTPLDLKTEYLDGQLLLVHLCGRLDSSTASLFDNRIQDVSAEHDGIKKILLVCQDLSYISSAGLSELLGLVRKLGGNGEVSLCQMPSAVHKVLHMAGFTKFIHVYDDIDKALVAMQEA